MSLLLVLMSGNKITACKFGLEYLLQRPPVGFPILPFNANLGMDLRERCKLQMVFVLVRLLKLFPLMAFSFQVSKGGFTHHP
eukprot:21991_4